MTDKTNISNHQLIEGIFSSEDARTVLMALIEYKIQFHEQDCWSQKERFGTVDETGIHRIDQLRKTKARLATVINDATASGKRLAINCTIEITPVSD